MHDIDPTVSLTCARCGSALAAAGAPCPACAAPEVAGVTAAPVTADLATGLQVLAPGQRIGSRYTIIRVLGRGGMGVVYQAWDDELNLAVAIKTVLPTAGIDAADSKRAEQQFKRELLLARQVSHRNVVRIHDIGEVSGTKYITMAFVDGETLAARMRRAGPMPIEKTLEIATQIADALAAAHDAGVVHRDLKPENVMLTREDQAIVMDFGIARSWDTTGRSSTGAIAGTIEYMSPEQAMGATTAPPADVYAFGLILYDMLSGRQRLTGREAPMSELIERTKTPPPPLQTRNITVPAPVQDLITRCVDPEPGRRFESGKALASALGDLTPGGWLKHAPATVRLPAPETAAAPRPWYQRTPIMVGAIAIVALVIAGLLLVPRMDTPPQTVAGDRPPISVLIADFSNTTGDPSFDGLIEQALAVNVEGSSFITAYPRRDAVRAAALLPDKTLSETNARLVAISVGVQVVVSGALETAASGYRLRARAIRPGANEQTLLEADADATGKDDVLPAVGRLAARLRNVLGDVTVDADRVRVDETFTATSLDAARAYVQGQEFFAAGRYDEAVKAYRQALAFDSTFGRAWSGLGAVANNRSQLSEADEAYRNALSTLDRMTEREQLRTRGAYYVTIRNAEKAIEENETLVQRFPSDVAGLTNLAVGYFMARRFDEARKVGAKAAAIYPNNVLRQNNVALFAIYGGAFADAEAQARRVLVINPNYVRAHAALAMSQLATNRIDEAKRTYAAMSKLPGGAAHAALGLADIALYSGRLAEAGSAVEAALATETSSSLVSRLALTLAETRLAQGRVADAAKEIARARQLAPRDFNVTFEAGRLLTAHRPEDAQQIAAKLGEEIDRDARSLSAVLAAEVALRRDDARTALARLDEARAQADSWLVRYTRGRAFIAAERFAEADSELQQCQRRIGEAAAMFLDDFPTWRHTASLQYYQARSRAGLNSPTASDAFKAFLAVKTGGDENSSMIQDARRRLGEK